MVTAASGTLGTVAFGAFPFLDKTQGGSRLFKKRFKVLAAWTCVNAPFDLTNQLLQTAAAFAEGFTGNRDRIDLP